jgi:hypothetical protein
VNVLALQVFNALGLDGLGIGELDYADGKFCEFCQFRPSKAMCPERGERRSLTRSGVEESRFFEKLLQVGQGARRSIQRRQERLPLCGVKPKRPPVGKSFIRARQSAFQHELAHGAMRYRRRCLQDALRVAGESQVKLLRTGGVRWHDITFILSLASMPDNVKTMVPLAMGRQPLAGIKNKIGKSWLLPGFPPSLRRLAFSRWMLCVGPS